MKKMTQIASAFALSAASLLAGIAISNRLGGDGAVPEHEKKEDIYKAGHVYNLMDNNQSSDREKARIRNLASIEASMVLLANFGGEKPVFSDDIPVKTLKDVLDITSRQSLRDKRQYFARAFNEKGRLVAEIRCTGRADCVMQPAMQLKPR